MWLTVTNATVTNAFDWFNGAALKLNTYVAISQNVS